MTVAPHRPELFLGGVAGRAGTPLAPAINRSAAARQIAIGRARARLDSAAASAPVSNRMDGQLLKRASAALGAHAVQVRDRADYVLLVNVRRLRIDARHGSQAWLDFGAAVSLIDQGTEHRIWHAKVTSREPLTASVRRDGHTASGALTAGALYTLTDEEFGGVLENVAAQTAQAVVDRLRSDLREAREDRSPPGE